MLAFHSRWVTYALVATLKITTKQKTLPSQSQLETMTVFRPFASKPLAMIALSKKKYLSTAALIQSLNLCFSLAMETQAGAAPVTPFPTMVRSFLSPNAYITYAFMNQVCHCTLCWISRKFRLLCDEFVFGLRWLRWPAYVHRPNLCICVVVARQQRRGSCWHLPWNSPWEVSGRLQELDNNTFDSSDRSVFVLWWILVDWIIAGTNGGRCRCVLCVDCYEIRE